MLFKRGDRVSSIAQEESRSISTNTTWGKRKSFADGKVTLGYKTFLGYDKGNDGKLMVNENEAKTIRLIYALFLKGYSTYQIKKELEKQKIKSPFGKDKWHVSTIKSELTNEKYKGDALLQKYFTTDYLSKKRKVNEGEVAQYYVTNNHEGIIDRKTFDYVQVELKKRLDVNKKTHGNNYTSRYSGINIFSGKIICGECGSFFGRKVWHSNDKYKKIIYRCNHKYKDKICETKIVTEDEIKELFVNEFNKLNRAETIRNTEILKEKLCDTKKLEIEKEKLIKEKDALIKKNDKLIYENSIKAMNQDTIKKEQDSISTSYRKIESKLDDIELEIREKNNRYIILDDYMRNLKSSKKIFDFDENLFCALVDNIIVTKNDIKIKWKGEID